MFISEAIENNMSPPSLEALREQGTRLERELAAPVRVVSSRAQARDLDRTLNDWRGRSAELRHYETTNADDFREKGITLIDYSWCQRTFGDSRPRSNGHLAYPEDAFTSSMRDTVSWNHFCGDTSSIESDGGIALTVDGAPDGANYAAMYEGRAVFYGYQFTDLAWYGTINWDYLFFDKIREAQDPAFREEIARRREEASRQAFASALRIRGGVAAAELRSRMGTIAGRIGEYQESLVNDQAEIAALGRQLNAVLADAGVELTDDQIAEEWQKILDLDHVVDFRMSETPSLEGGDPNHKMIVTTDLLWITHPETNRTVPLGEFSIELNFGDNTTRIYNTSMRQRRMNGAEDPGYTLRGREEDRAWDHPHVENGRLCAGEFSGTITTLLRQRKLSTMIGMILNVLRAVTIRDEWGRANMPLWIEADDARRQANDWPAWTEDEEIHPMLANDDTGGE